MGKYGQAAKIAAQKLTTGTAQSPQNAWESAVIQIFPDSPSSRSKGCPKDAFLALCETGAIENVPSGTYTRSLKNKAYVLRALSALRSNPALVNDEKNLWLIAADDAGKIHNSQMDVVATLFRANIIR